MSKAKQVVALAGDGIGEEVMPVALEVLEAALEGSDKKLEIASHPVGAKPLLGGGSPLPASTLKACVKADAVLLGALGDPRFDDREPAERPEAALLELREQLEVHANLRPARFIEAIADCSPLKPEVGRNADIMIVRELRGGIYFGRPRVMNRSGSEPRRALNTMVYDETEIERVARRAFELARSRRGRLVSVDKANVLEVSRLWRNVVTELSSEYPDVELRHAFVDAFALELACRPSELDVVLTANLFGDILSDQAAMLNGGLGLLPSASLGGRTDLYEPVHGSAPDIAGRGVANPTAMVLSAAMMLRYSFGWEEEAKRIEAAVDGVLCGRGRPADLARPSDEVLTTKAMGEAIRERLTKERV